MTLVLAHGCFDLLHLGHVRHLQAARALGDWLVVTVTDDPYVNKGPGRPAFPAIERAEMLNALECVCEVKIIDSAEEAIKAFQPDIYVKGVEYRGRLPEQELVESYGGRVHFTSEPTYSSSAILTGQHLKAKSLGGR